MLPTFFASDPINAGFKISFSYRQSKAYEEGLFQRTKILPALQPLRLPDLPETLRESHVARRIALIPYRCARPLLNLGVMLYCILRIYCLLLKLRPDVLHINNGGYPGALSPRATALAGKLYGKCRIVFVVNNMASGYSRWARWFDYHLDRLISRCVDMFVTGSTAANDRLGIVLGLPQNKIKTIPNGIHIPVPTIPAAEIRSRLKDPSYKGKIIGVIARLEYRKGHHVLIEAAKILEKKGDISPQTLHIVFKGQGPAEKELRIRIQQARLEEYFTIITNPENPADIIAASDIVVLPAIASEDFPFAVLEAMALGKAVIASKIAGIPEQIVSGLSGLLVEPGNPAELASNILRLLLNPSEVDAMGRQAFTKYQKEFRAESCAVQYLALYNQLLNGAGTPPIAESANTVPR